MALDGAGEGTPDDAGTRHSVRVDHHRRHPGQSARLRAAHEGQEQLYAAGLDQIEELNDARRLRLVAAEEGIPGVLWSVLIFGGIAAIGFTYLFGIENTWAHRLMVVILAAVIGLVLFTIGSLEHPFSEAPA